MKKLIALSLISFLAGCSLKDKYDVARYYDAPAQDRILTNIITYIFDAPPLTKMNDRFKPEHHNYYSSLTPNFSIVKYFVSDEGTHYFYIIRPSPDPAQKRGVGGHFKMDGEFKLTVFREVFVTPMLPESEIKGRCAFLFDEMVKGSIDQYLTMSTFVQWPNPASFYDTVTFEWKLKPELEEVP